MSELKDLKKRIREFLLEIEYKHLKEDWVKHVAELGLNEREAHRWAAEIGHVVDEFQSRLRSLVDFMEESDPDRIPVRLYNWTFGITEVTVPEIVDPMEQLQKMLQKYIPPEPEDEDES